MAKIADVIKYESDNSTFIILEDKVNELTARLIITIEALYIWKAEILSYLNLDANKEDKQ